MHTVTFKDKIKKDGAPPPELLGYLSQTAGSFTLDGRSGHASFVWYHDDDLLVDWHNHAMEFVGTLEAAARPGEQPVVFWGYKVADHGDDDTAAKQNTQTAQGGHDHDDEELYFFFAERRTNSDKASDSDEGFRIFYGIHDELHLMAWDGRTFAYHKHE